MLLFVVDSIVDGAAVVAIVATYVVVVIVDAAHVPAAHAALMERD